MSEGLLKEPDGVVADFHVKFHSDTEPPPSGDPGNSLVQEVALLRQQVQQLCAAVRALVQLQSVANQKLGVAIKGNADCGVL